MTPLHTEVSPAPSTSRSGTLSSTWGGTRLPESRYATGRSSGRRGNAVIRQAFCSVEWSRRATLAAGFLWMAGCGMSEPRAGAPPGPISGWTVRDSMGIEIVTSPEAALHHPLPWRLEVERVVEGNAFGPLGGGQRHLIPNGTRFAFVGDTFFTIDFDARELRTFGPTGPPSMIRLPEPPPLLGTYSSMLMVPGGTGEIVMGYHERTQSLVEIHPSTGSVSAKPFPPLGEGKGVSRFFGSMGSLVLASWGAVDALMNATIERGLHTFTQTLGVLDGTTAHIDIIGDYPVGTMWFSAAITAIGLLPNSPMLVVGVGMDRVYVANTHSSDIEVFDQRGVHVRTLRMEGIPVHFSQAERDSIIEASIAGQPGLAPGRHVWGESVTVWPSVDHLIVDREGWLWALMPGISPDRVPRWVVFDPEGRMRGWVPTTLDPALEIQSIGHTHVLGTVRGSDGARTVEVLRLVR
jgi:hypothetical protein